MRRALIFSLFDAAWWLMGFGIWVLHFGAAEVTTECHTTRHKFRFPGWNAE